MASPGEEVVIVGAGVAGCAIACELALRGVQPLLVEAKPRLGLGASGANSGILHTGFDSAPGELETRLILRAAELRAKRAAALGLRVWRCGARMRAADDQQRASVRALAANAEVNGVEARLVGERELLVPGESVTDPRELLERLAESAVAAGAVLRLGAPVERLLAGEGGSVTVELAGGELIGARAAVNCAGLHGDTVAGAQGFEVYPRKGEFLVFEQPPGNELQEILLPVPSSAGKGVLVFPTIDGHLIAGPTARDCEDKADWSVESDTAELVLPKAKRMFAALEGLAPVAAYAGLRPAGRGVNYVIEPSRSLPGLVNVAAIRSTGLTAALAIGEHVAALLAESAGVTLGAPREPPVREPPDGATGKGATDAAAADGEPWWRLAAQRSAAGRGST